MTMISKPIAQRLFAATLALLFVAGCGGPLETDYSELNLASVSGTVTLDDEPLAGATVIFEAEDQTYSYGVTDGSGRYTLMFNSEKEGVLPGPKTVRITMRPVGEESEDGKEGDPAEAGPSPSAGTIPARYNRLSELRVTVQEGSQRFDFPLESL